MDERSLVERAKAGSSEAFTALVRQYQSRIRAFLSRYVHDDDLADDLAQEVFLSAYRSMDAYQPGSGFGVWLIVIARNQALTYFRGEKRRREREARSVRSTLDQWRVEQLDAGGWSPSRDDRKLTALEECLKRLPGHSAEIVSLHYRDGMKAVEIARETGKSDGWARMMLLRVRQALRRCIEQRLALESS